MGCEVGFARQELLGRRPAAERTVPPCRVAVHTPHPDHNFPISYPGKSETEKIPGLAGVEKSAKASRDGRPGKVRLVGGSATRGKLGAVGRIGEQSHERVVEFVGLI